VSRKQEASIAASQTDEITLPLRGHLSRSLGVSSVKRRRFAPFSPTATTVACVRSGRWKSVAHPYYQTPDEPSGGGDDRSRRLIKVRLCHGPRGFSAGCRASRTNRPGIPRKGGEQGTRPEGTSPGRLHREAPSARVDSGGIAGYQVPIANAMDWRTEPVARRPVRPSQAMYIRTDWLAGEITAIHDDVDPMPEHADADASECLDPSP
jgi:hypothetical protein